MFRDSDGLWKVERNVGEIILDESKSYNIKLNDNPEYSSYYISNIDIAIMAKMTSSHYPFIEHTGYYPAREGQQIRNYSDTSASIMITDYTMTHSEFRNKLKNSPVTVVYEKRSSENEVLPQSLQDKLNNLRTFKDSNYIYTVLPDKSNILSENLKPTLHSTFKSIGWETFRKRIEQGGN